MNARSGVSESDARERSPKASNDSVNPQEYIILHLVHDPVLINLPLLKSVVTKMFLM